jgi:hypothetical protein
MEVKLPAFDHRRYNARLIPGRARDNQQMRRRLMLCGSAGVGISKPALISLMKEVACERKNCLRFRWRLGCQLHSSLCKSIRPAQTKRRLYLDDDV